MSALPKFKIAVYGNHDLLPAEAAELFAGYLAESRRAFATRKGKSQWSYTLVCALARQSHVLGGVLMDLGPIGGKGPSAQAKLAYLELTLVRPQYRRQGLATRLLKHTIGVARQAGCLYIRCSNNWDNDAERRLFLKCGFALVDMDGEDDLEPCYLAIRCCL